MGLNESGNPRLPAAPLLANLLGRRKTRQPLTAISGLLIILSTRNERLYGACRDQVWGRLAWRRIGTSRVAKLGADGNARLSVILSRLIPVLLISCISIADAFAIDLNTIVTYTLRNGDKQAFPGAPAKILGVSTGEPLTVTQLAYRDTERGLIYACDVLADGRVIITRRSQSEDTVWLLSASGELLRTLQGRVAAGVFSIRPNELFRFELQETEELLFAQAK